MKTIARLCFLSLLFVTEPAQADGLIVIVPPEHQPSVNHHFSFAPLEVSYHRVRVDIDEQRATTAIDQAFYNPNNRRLEGNYIFPMPEGAHIDSFSMDINGSMQQAELLDADKARKLYEDIVRKAKDPALLEYIGRGAFKVRIFPIEPHATKQIKINYTQILKSDNGLSEYVYPLNTEKFSSAPLQDVSIRVDIDSSTPLKSIYSPSHHVEIKRHGERSAVVGFEEKDTRPDSDFKLVFSSHEKEIGIDLLTHKPSGEDGFFMLMLSPGQLSKTKELPAKDLCFVLDTSGSMMGKKLVQAKKALAFCIENLPDSDRFEIIRFSTEAEPHFGQLVEASPQNIKRAKAFINQLKPIGGTAIHEALTKAVSMRSASDRSRPYHIVFLTDGLPTIGESSEDQIVKDATAESHTRIFSFGIGEDVNTHLLDRIAEQSRAISSYVLPEEDLEIKLSNFYTKIARPVLTNLKLKFTRPEIRTSALYPRRLPDLFNGDQLIVYGRYRGDGPSALELSGELDGKTVRLADDILFPANQRANSYIADLWATRRIGWLLDEIRLHGESKELKDEITQLARKYGVVTPYTAYLILEDEAIRNIPILHRNMREMASDSDAVIQAKGMYHSLQIEAADESRRSGRMATGNAIAVQQLKYSYNLKQTNAGPLLNKKTSGKQTKDYNQQARIVNGRSFYQNGNIWNDSTAQSKKQLKQKTIRFNSNEYFEFLNSNIVAAQWLALGANIDLVIEDTLYQIRN